MDDPVEAARARMDVLFRRAGGLKETAHADSEFLDTFSEILEELEAASEELRQQNEELMAARSQVEQERERYQGLFEFAPDAYLVTSPRGIIQEANAAACELLNVSYKSLIGKPLLVFLDQQYADLYHRAIAHPKDRHAFEIRIQPRSLLPVDVAVTMAATFEVTGRPAQLRWMLRDISERQQLFAALDQSERRFRTIFEEASIGILLLTPDGKFARANPAFLNMLGYSEEELAGRAMRVFTFPDDLKIAQEMFQKMVDEQRRDTRMQMRYLCKDGSIAWADVSLSLLYAESGELQYSLCITEDITAKRAYQSELEEMRRRLLESGEVERRRLAQELHDGPMQDLYGVVFRLAGFTSQENDHLPSSRAELQEIQESIKQVAGTLRSVCGELRPPTIANLGLERAIRSHAESIQARHPELNMELQLTSDGNMLEPHVRMAFFRIYQQCMSNMLRHAQATRVLVSFFASDEEIVLDIWDNGKGFSMPDKWVEFLREGHYGLAGIAERVDALGGTLKIDTKPGAGTLVHVSAPRLHKA